MCTAFSYCRVHQQRLRGFGTYAPKSSGSSGVGPWALRPKRLQWLTNISTGFKIAAFRSFALSLKANIHPSISICGLEASGGHSPPFSSFQLLHGPP